MKKKQIDNQQLLLFLRYADWAGLQSRLPSMPVLFFVFFYLFYFIITYSRWGQSTSYNVAHPACSHKGPTQLSPVHAYEFLSRCSFSTPTHRQPMVELFVLASSRFLLQKSEEKFTPAESRTHKFRRSGRMLYPLVHGGSPLSDNI